MDEKTYLPEPDEVKEKITDDEHIRLEVYRNVEEL